MDPLSREYWTRSVNAALIRFVVLREVCARPGHAYALIRRVAAVTRNVFLPAEATIYPALAELERCGCVRADIEIVAGRERKVYAATATGREACRLGREAWRKGFDAALGPRHVRTAGRPR
jgi:DNA-binding PadR family transcriptional regulator